MPSAPLYYQPIVQARIAMTPVNDTTVGEAVDRQLNFAFQPGTNGGERLIKPVTSAAEAFAQSEGAGAFARFLTDIEDLQKATPGSEMFTGIQIASDETGWAANRVQTMFRNHPDLLDTASPDEAAQIAANIVTQAKAEYAKKPGIMVSGGTLEMSPTAAQALGAHLDPKAEMPAALAGYLALQVGKAVQTAVTPMPPDSEGHPLQWIEGATPDLLALWPGALSRTAAALHLRADAAPIEEFATGERTSVAKSSEGYRSVQALLGAAGIGGTSPVDAAFQVLQSTPLPGVPIGMAQAIVGAQKLDPAQMEYVATRIIETQGAEGNVRGLIAELDQMRNHPGPLPGPDS